MVLTVNLYSPTVSILTFKILWPFNKKHFL